MILYLKRYDRNYTVSSSNNRLDSLDPLGRYWDTGILNYEFAGIQGEITLDSVTLSFNYEENPDWIAPAPSEVPIPAAAWLFGSALLGLGAMKRKKA